MALEQVWIVAGTRPEVLKQAPLLSETRRSLGEARVKFVAVRQHDSLLDQALAEFSVSPDLTIQLPPRPSTLGGLTELLASLIKEIGAAISQTRPSIVVVQGDTMTAAAFAQAAFLNGVPVLHNEAGLRSGDLAHPFPEEANRKLISTIATRHYAPTDLAFQNLCREGVSKSHIKVVGNTGIDALKHFLGFPCPPLALEIVGQMRGGGRRFLLGTAHRRENAGVQMRSWFENLKKWLVRNPDWGFLYLSHPNGAGAEAFRSFLGETPRAFMLEPQSYSTLVHLLNHCDGVMTDSGGIQEECATLGIPTLVCRQTTERPEGLQTGVIKLVGHDIERFVTGLDWIKSRESLPRISSTVFGRGDAAQWIAADIKEVFD